MAVERAMTVSGVMPKCERDRLGQTVGVAHCVRRQAHPFDDLRARGPLPSAHELDVPGHIHGDDLVELLGIGEFCPST